MHPPLLSPIHREGWPIIGICAVIALVLGILFEPLGWAGALVTAWSVYFFRDPDRVTPERPGLVVSPADGLIQKIDRAVPPEELDMGEAPMKRIAVFMNVLDVHVNRMPTAATITRSSYRTGKFLNASFDKASDDNERQSLRLRTAEGNELAVVQIAGLIARRIRCWAREGETLVAGQRFGMIRMGSRLEVYLPESSTVLVLEGQRALAGETVIADLTSDETDRTGHLG